MTGIESPKVADKMQLRGLYLPESRAGDQTVAAVGEVAPVADGKADTVEIRKALNL